MLYAFPAHAGMNRRSGNAGLPLPCVPRTRGDEPLAHFAIYNTTLRSPHTRG